MGKKALLGIIFAVIVGYLAWRWFAPAPTQRAPVTPAQTQRIATKPKPVAVRSTPAKRTAAQRPGASRPTPTRPVAQQQRLAPEGTFFLLQRASLPIDSGVIGFAPGTKVTLVEQAHSVSTVTDGEYQFKVPSSQLTNDLDLAASVAKADYTTQAQIAESTARRAQEYSQQQRDAVIASEKEKAQKKTGKKTPPRAASPAPKR
jgi:hypothetical protein